MMINLPLVTFGIPIYNAADLIERTILSALNQTYPNIEFLFIDDKGNSMDIVKRVIENHPRKSAIRVIDQIYNQGTGAARNAIISHASGEYLFTMDCDDIIIPSCIDTLYKKMAEHPVDFVAASFIRRGLDGKIYPGGCQYDDVLIEETDYAVAKYRYEQGNKIFVATWNKLYRTDFLRKNNIQCVPHYLIDDTWFTYQVILAAHSCRLISDSTLFFTYNPQSVTSIKEADGYTDFLSEQYLGTEILKIDYIKSLRDKKLYISLLLDILKMSLYHLYRACESPKISKDEKNKYISGFLARRFAYPQCWSLGNKNLYKLLPLLCFYGLPMWLKKYTVQFMVHINVRSFLRHWFHF